MNIKKYIPLQTKIYLTKLLARAGFVKKKELYVKSAPSEQVAIDIFKGDWATNINILPNEVVAGVSDLCQDPNFQWFLDVFDVSGMEALELGPLEGAHSYMLEKHGAKSILAIEANTKAYLKCLIFKEIVKLKKTSYMCGDFVEFFKASNKKFDLVVASGVLYHMIDPVELLTMLAKASDNIYIWTQYYDEELVSKIPARQNSFSESYEHEFEGFKCTYHHIDYGIALDHSGFCGGLNLHANWMEREDILKCLRHLGFNKIQIGREVKNFRFGPCFSFCASR